MKRVINNGRKKVNQLRSIISNRNINLTARRLLLLSVLRPSIEYGSEVWKCNKSQASALESILLGGAKKILGCSSRTCNEAVRGDMGLETFKSHRDKTKLKWWYKLASMSVRRYPRQLFDQEWKVKARRGRQRKPWNKYVDELFDVLGLPKGELYKTFGKEVEFKRYLHGVSDAGIRLLFKFRSGTHGLNEELGRHRGRNGRTECVLCGDECENVVHVLWECPAYKDIVGKSFRLSLGPH